MGELSTESQKKGRLGLGVLGLQVTVTPGSFSEQIRLTAPPRCPLLCSLPIWSSNLMTQLLCCTFLVWDARMSSVESSDQFSLNSSSFGFFWSCKQNCAIQK